MKTQNIAECSSIRKFIKIQHSIRDKAMKRLNQKPTAEKGRKQQWRGSERAASKFTTLEDGFFELKATEKQEMQGEIFCPPTIYLKVGPLSLVLLLLYNLWSFVKALKDELRVSTSLLWTPLQAYEINLSPIILSFINLIHMPQLINLRG